MPLAGKLSAVQLEINMALLHAGRRIVLRGPGALVPDKNGTRTVFALGNGAFKGRIGDRMVLHVDGQPLFVRVQAGAARNGPAPQHAVMLQPKIVMQARGGMLVDDKDASAVLARALPCDLAGRLGRLREIALGAVLLQASHGRTAQLDFRLDVGLPFDGVFLLEDLPLEPSSLSAARLFLRASKRLTTLDGFSSFCLGREIFFPALLARISSITASSYLSSNSEGSNFEAFFSMTFRASSIISLSVFRFGMSASTVSGWRTVRS